MQPPNAGPLFTWSDVVHEYIGFLGTFALLGAAGFWAAVARPFLRAAAAHDAPMARAARGAARVGLVGAVLTILVTLVGLAGRAAEKGISFGEAARAGGVTLAIAGVLLAFLLLAFALLSSGRSRGLWPAAAIAVVALVLRNAVQLRWQTIVNPLHVLAGGLWIGTLAVLALTVIPLGVRRELGRNGSPSIAQVVARFSRLSLFSVALLVASGLVTAWRHLKYVAALWTTPYGWVLMAKLAMVAVVAALGLFNWRRVSPALGAEDGAERLQRSARAELLAAGIVLAITALLVSVPAPRAPKGAAAPAAEGAPAGATPPAQPAAAPH